MPIDLTVLSRQIQPERTVLILGAGASIPSGAPTANDLKDELGQHFSIENHTRFSLSDLATIIEAKFDRRQLVDFIRKRIQRLQPTGGLLSIPLFPWGAIFSTNYDDLVEKAYRRCDKHLRVYSSNHDFHGAGMKDEQELLKFHGTIEKDICDGSNSKIIITSTDYDEVSAYRELLYSRLRDSLYSKSVLIVGQSLSDPDLRSLVDDAQKLKANSGAPGKIFLFVFEQNEDLAAVFEARGLTVCFGGIDELFNALLRAAPDEQLVLSVTSEVLSAAPILETSTLNVETALANQVPQLDRMFSGRPASYADIAREWTFDRNIANQIETQVCDENGKPISLILGAAGVGKTTAVRLAFSRLVGRDIVCWEHNADFAFEVDEWVKINEELGLRKSTGVLFIDDAHQFLRQINRLVEILTAKDHVNLRLILVSSKPHWNPRLKSAELFKNSVEYELSRLNMGEINGLLDLLDSSAEIRALVEDSFLGFNRQQRLERLKERCSADMFVCMKNIFGYQSIDTILLEEFASLSEDLQHIYRIIAGMQAVGAKVHRELVRRITGLQAGQVARVLDDMDGIIEEYTVSERDGIFGWKVRHPLIAGILTKYKYSTEDELYDLFERIVDTVNPAYRFEVQSLNDMCDLETGITRLNDRSRQNVILRRMISKAPNLRVPRHRLIHNLIVLGKFDVAESEIRIFEKELRSDGPVLRYKIRLKLGIAKHTDGIQSEDRAAFVTDAAVMARKCIETFPDDKNMYRIFLDTGVDLFRYTSNAELFVEAMQAATEAQERLLDPELRSIIARYSRTGEEMGVNVY